LNKAISIKNGLKRKSLSALTYGPLLSTHALQAGLFRTPIIPSDGFKIEESNLTFIELMSTKHAGLN
jgi:hypothetical protein